MNDTPDHIQKKQLTLWLAKPVSERFQIALDTIDEVNLQIETRIKQQTPNISDHEMRIEFILQNYRNDLSPSYLQEVFSWIRSKTKIQS